MTIKKGTPIGRRNGPEVNGIQGYDWFTYCTNELANIVQSGDNKPTEEQMLEADCMVGVPTDYNHATHKLIPNSFNDDGVEIKQNTVALTADEITVNTESAKQTDILTARMDGSITLLELVTPYSEEERGTWPTQEAEARAWRVDNNAPCLMIRQIAFHRGITMDVMVAKIMDSVELFQYVAGDILGIQQKAIDDIEAE